MKATRPKAPLEQIDDVSRATRTARLARPDGETIDIPASAVHCPTRAPPSHKTPPTSPPHTVQRRARDTTTATPADTVAPSACVHQVASVPRTATAWTDVTAGTHLDDSVEVEGLVGGFPRGGSSPLRRIDERSACAGLSSLWWSQASLRLHALAPGLVTTVGGVTSPRHLATWLHKPTSTDQAPRSRPGRSPRSVLVSTALAHHSSFLVAWHRAVVANASKHSPHRSCPA
jgi:hypothetical protein